MNGISKLASEIKKRDNINYIGTIIGVVENTAPLTISIYGGKAIYKGDSIYVCRNATEYQIPFQLHCVEGTVSGKVTHPGLKQKDKVVAIASQDNQKLFILDKLV